MDIKLSLLKDNEGYGIIVFNGCIAIGCFEIDYCPKCGRELRSEYE
jgi:hypothetical protein